jgi:hypothetical protein
VFLLSSDILCRIKLERFLSSLLFFIRSNILTLISLLFLALHNVSLSLNIFISSLHTLVPSVQGFRDVR